MKFKDMSTQDKMDFCARWLLIHSILYYSMDKNIVSDADYDTKLKWLCTYSQKHLAEVEQCRYKDVLLNLDPSTGFDMQNYVEPKHYEYLKQITHNIYKQYIQDTMIKKGG